MFDLRRKFIGVTMVAAILMASGLVLAACRDSASAPPAADDSTSDAAQVQKPELGLIKELSAAFEYAASRVSPSVVPIYAEQVVKVENPFGSPDDPFRQFFGDDFFKRFFGVPQQPSQQTIHSLGSGVIFSEDGYILTNNHVVAKARKLYVFIGENQNQKRYSARVIGTDPPTDLAVVKIDARNLPAAKLGDSNQVKVGEWVIAVGNPFQLLHTVTAGIISAKGRSSVGLADYEDFFQTDASINPGNSGGALADLDGNVIGINTAIESPSGGNIGIGFAIPINMAKTVMPQLMAKGKVLRGYLDLTLQTIDDELAKALKLKSTKGVLISSVGPGGPADKAGLKQGDVLIAINGRPVSNSTQLRDEISGLAPGTSVKFTLIRDGREMEVPVVLGERPAAVTAASRPEQEQKPLSSEKLGLSVQTLTPELANQLGYRGEQGVLVAGVDAGSVADDAGLQRGDLIKEVNRTAVRTTREFEDILRKLKSGDTVALLVMRGQSTFYVAITLQ